ncbi:MAG TPA: YjgN family protein [Rudaea sp.]
MTETTATDASETAPSADVPAPSADAPAPPPPASEAAPDPVPPPAEHPFEFRGNEREYFRIWIVNLALTIVTFGIWSAWAKVRTERYFYANTRVAATPFEYLARPLPILKGRLIAFTLLTSYILASRFSIKLQLALLVMIGLLSPWLIVRTLMFRARYSSWRGLNFRFVPDYGGAYKYFLLIYLLFPLTLGFIFPYVKWRQKKFLIEHHRFGRRDFDFSATASEFYVIYFIAIGMVIALWIAFAAILPMITSGIQHGSGMTGLYAMLAVAYAGYFVIFVYLASRVLNLSYNHTAMSGFALRSTVRARDLMRLYFFNTLGILLSLGMLIPWAMIRMARYRASRLVLLASDDLDTLEAEAQGEVSAVGAEIDHAFDMDIGL